VFPYVVTCSMGKIRRGNFVFLSWVGDHSPRHVHVYKDGKLIVKWDLENWQAMSGKATRRILEHIRDLIREGLL
jgi:hypothetical protein